MKLPTSHSSWDWYKLIVFSHSSCYFPNCHYDRAILYCILDTFAMILGDLGSYSFFFLFYQAVPLFGVSMHPGLLFWAVVLRTISEPLECCPSLFHSLCTTEASYSVLVGVIQGDGPHRPTGAARWEVRSISQRRECPSLISSFPSTERLLACPLLVP